MSLVHVAGLVRDKLLSVDKVPRDLSAVSLSQHANHANNGLAYTCASHEQATCFSELVFFPCSTMQHRRRLKLLPICW